ncbi:hypothetical protein KQY30_18145 [Streptomyces sp. GMY02]|uniref:DUF6251 family protein n=1 Tax=Streptomyces sp. GMY02 TaxID=1333528 RepID=UPI001C2C21DC|nr:DUF6251 family protein [Streptomyces sp. GMY02]QXE39219.1 hypothetical protein KQY30_18145 [Streptomyces sp. GMY02]
MEHLPAPRTVVQLPDGTHAYIDPATLPVPQQQAGIPQVVHIHQAAPDRTVQRVALGSGIGAGAVGASVYFGPMLIAAITSMAVSLAVAALVVIAITYGLVTVVRSVGGTDGKNAAAQAAPKSRRGRRGRS